MKVNRGSAHLPIILFNHSVNMFAVSCMPSCYNRCPFWEMWDLRGSIILLFFIFLYCCFMRMNWCTTCSSKEKGDLERSKRRVRKKAARLKCRVQDEWQGQVLLHPQPLHGCQQSRSKFHFVHFLGAEPECRCIPRTASAFPRTECLVSISRWSL